MRVTSEERIHIEMTPDEANNLLWRIEAILKQPGHSASKVLNRLVKALTEAGV